MKPRVYIETSVVCALVEQRLDAVSQTQAIQTRAWWTTQRPHFDCYGSGTVETEVSDPTYPYQSEALGAMKELRVLPVSDRIEGIARVYQEQMVMPRENSGDALHLAFACVYEMDYLLTWNYKHLANMNKLRHIQVINARLGLMTPFLLTPPMLTISEEEI